MKLYADLPARRTRQVLLDLLVLGWVVLWVRAAFWVHGLAQGLAGPGRALESAGRDLRAGLTGAAEQADNIPLAGEDLRRPLDAAAAAGDRLAAAGARAQGVADDLALALALGTAVLPVLVVLGLWLPGRVRWVRAATAATRIGRDGADLSLFALRALVNRPVRELARCGPDPAGALLRGDAEVMRRLAALELATQGLSVDAEPGGRLGGLRRRGATGSAPDL